MTITASRPPSNRAGKSSYKNQTAAYDQMNNSAGPSYSNNVNTSTNSRHFYLNGDEEEDAIDELRAISSSQVMPYELDTGSMNGDAQPGDEGVDESDQEDDDELSTTSGRRHGALLQPEEADLIIFEVRKSGPARASYPLKLHYSLF